MFYLCNPKTFQIIGNQEISPLRIMLLRINLAATFAQNRFVIPTKPCFQSLYNINNANAISLFEKTFDFGFCLGPQTIQ